MDNIRNIDYTISTISSFYLNIGARVSLKLVYYYIEGISLDRSRSAGSGGIDMLCAMEERCDFLEESTNVTTLDMECGLLDDNSGAIDDSPKTNQTKDRMTELIGLQKSNGIFDISSKDWAESILECYAGKYEDVKSSCPPGVKVELWITALSIKIMELKMSNQKELWELVAQKSKKSLNVELNKNKDQLQMLLDQAEEYLKRITTKTDESMTVKITTAV